MKRTGVTIVPTNEGRAAEDVSEALSLQAQLAVMRCAGREDHSIVEVLQFVDAHIPAYMDIADEADVLCQRCLFIA